MSIENGPQGQPTRSGAAQPGWQLTEPGRPIRRGPYPELTWPAVIVGWLLGSIIALSIGYAALILGFSIEGSELAAILGWGILRGLLRRTSIVENNINQTIASAVNGASAGIMFSVPAALILAKDPNFAGADQFSSVILVLACIAGGLLGLAFVIPLRKQMIDFNRLAYPGGVAVAAILKSPGAGLRKAMFLFGGAVVAALAHLVVLFLDTENAHVGDLLGLPSYLNVTFYLSLMTVGVGFIAGRGGMVFGYGGFICYFLLAPLLAHFGSPDVQEMIHPVQAAQAEGQVLSQAEQEAALVDVPDDLRFGLFRPVGIGMLIGAAIGGIIAAFPLVASALRSMRDAARKKGAAGSDELPLKILAIAIVVGAVALYALAEFSHPQMSLWRAGLMALLGTVWIWIAGVIIAECVGRTNWSPLSGMTLIAVTILILIAHGMDRPAVIVSSIVVGAAVCCAIAQAGDMMLDLKSGYLIGALPRRQQVAQVIGMWLGPILVVWLMFTLHQSNEGGLGAGKLSAPQGTALASVIKGLVGGDAPTWRYAAGTGLGALLAFSGLGGVGVQIGLGFYMPFEIVLTYTIGALIRMAVDASPARRKVDSIGIPIAAGLIVGEAMVGVGNALVKIYAAA